MIPFTATPEVDFFSKKKVLHVKSVSDIAEYAVGAIKCKGLYKSMRERHEVTR